MWANWFRAWFATSSASPRSRLSSGLSASAFGFAGGAAFFGSCCLVAAAVLGFSNVLRPWLAAIIVGVALFLLGGFVVMPGWKAMMERRPPIPDDTVDSVKADVAAVRDALRQ
jgi:Putative Actinobacterial Holin-X, holin superfamily III